MVRTRQLAALLTVVSLGSGCFSKTRIYSKPSGANVTIDQNRRLGKTPVELDEMVWMWTKHQLTVEADGYAPSTIQIRSTGVNWGYAVVCVCSLGLLLPLGLASEYPKQYYVELQPTGSPPAEDADVSGAQATLRSDDTVSFQ